MPSTEMTIAKSLGNLDFDFKQAHTCGGVVEPVDMIPTLSSQYKDL